MEETNRAKDQFLATVSHELRTPLASIIGFCELISEMPDLNPQLRRFVSIVMRNAEREARLVEDLLTLVTLDDQGLDMRPAPTNLTTVVRSRVESIQLQPAAADIDLSVQCPAGPLTVWCDEERVGQALDNLLSNALKFTPAGGRINVLLESSTTMARIEVSDNGIGIGGPDPDRVFERFYRSPHAIEHQIPGAGLGLPIAAAIVHAHHGTIRVLTTSERGSTFEIRLPLKGDPDAAGPP